VDGTSVALKASRALENFLCDESEVETSVLEYLRRHPQATDSVAGIVEWWLPRQRYETALERISSILERMVSDNRLTRRTLPDGATVYSLRRTQ
jgi:hypothetical protein